jgi:chemotaxis phosphatase CheX-like protein
MQGVVESGWPVELSEWLDAAASSAQEIASGALGMADTHWQGKSTVAMPRDLCGVYIPLLTDGYALQLGLLAPRDTCTLLARALLGDMDGEAAVESDSDVFDAVGEITNLIAGQIKVALAEKVSIRVGVPLAIRGRVFPLGGSRSIYGELRLDQGHTWLVMSGTRMS